MIADYRLEIVNNQTKLEQLVKFLTSVPVIALDIETSEWWNRKLEQIALIQLAFHHPDHIKVAVIDTLAKIDLTSLQTMLASEHSIKVMHNAAFDAVKLAKFYNFEISPVFDTMLAARRSGEKKYSLAAQAAIYLQIHLDKSSQKSDWSRRPLDLKQINYAALDAVATLLLYENQRVRNLHGNYQLKSTLASQQPTFSFENLLAQVKPSETESVIVTEQITESENESSDASLTKPLSVLLSIISKLPSRYSPEQLAVSVGVDRVGLAGWITDQIMGSETDFDEETARIVIAGLLERKLIKFTETRRLAATDEGIDLWRKLKAKYDY